MADLEPGTTFAGCRIDGVLGRGGMGVVYGATDERLGRQVALKVISQASPKPSARARFEREARLTAAIEHPNVIPVYGAGEEDGVLYLITRRVAGTDLDTLLRDGGSLPASRAASIVAQIASALDAAHEAGLVHRDVKPANVLLADGDHVYLSDFGITLAQDEGTDITDSGAWAGTLDFMSPEQLRGEGVDHRSDIYALGCVLHTALTGTPPMRRRTPAKTIEAHLKAPVPPVSVHRGVPTTFDAIVARALAKNPEDRYRTAGELGRAALVAGSGSLATAIDGGRPEDRVPGDWSGPATAVVGREGDRPTRRAPPQRPFEPGEPDQVQPRRHKPPYPPPRPQRRHTDPGYAPPRGSEEQPSDEQATIVARPDEQATVVAGGGPGPTVVAPSGDAPTTVARPTEEQPPDAAPIRRLRSRNRRIAGALGAVLVLAGLVAYVWAIGRPQPVTSGPISTAELRAMVGAFANAYSRGSQSGMRTLLAPDAERVAPDSRQSGRQAVAAEYGRQFRTSPGGRYTVSGLRLRAGDVGRAEAGYTVSRSGAPSLRGRITILVVRRSGRPEIRLLASEPAA